MKSLHAIKIAFLLFIFVFTACSSRVVLPPLPGHVTSQENGAKFFVKPIIIIDTRMSNEMRENAIAMYQNLVFEKLSNLNKLALNKEEAKYELDLIVQKYFKRNAEGYLSPFGGGPKSDHMETLAIVKDIDSGEELGRGRIFYRDPSVFGSLSRMIEDSAEEIVNYVSGKKR